MEDDEEKKLGLPQGPHDIPLMIQDRMFGSDGSFVYDSFHHLAAKGELFWSMAFHGPGWRLLHVNIDFEF